MPVVERVVAGEKTVYEVRGSGHLLKKKKHLVPYRGTDDLREGVKGVRCCGIRNPSPRLDFPLPSAHESAEMSGREVFLHGQVKEGILLFGGARGVFFGSSG
jgi:hypothetical protein